jgi:hypothetical protein
MSIAAASSSQSATPSHRNEAFHRALESHLRDLPAHEKAAFTAQHVDVKNVAEAVAGELNKIHREGSRVRRGLEAFSRWIEALRTLFEATDAFVSSNPTIAGLL